MKWLKIFIDNEGPVVKSLTNLRKEKNFPQKKVIKPFDAAV